MLTGNLLRIANSPAYKVHERPVESLQRAVTLVGTEGVRQIISAVLVQPVMQVQCGRLPRFSTASWAHARRESEKSKRMGKVSCDRYGGHTWRQRGA